MILATNYSHRSYDGGLAGSLGKDASRSSDDQLSCLSDTNKSLVNVLMEKDRIIKQQASQPPAPLGA